MVSGEVLGELMREIADIREQQGRLLARVEMLEQRSPTMPHVVLGEHEVLVLNGADMLNPAEVAELRASVEAAGFAGRVIVIAEHLRAEIRRDTDERD